MNENLKDGTAKASARRRLIRGVFAAPAALTLFSGSVAAGSLSCVAAVVNNPPVNMIVDGTSTSILRVPLRDFVDANGDVQAKFVKADDLGSLLPVTPASSPDEWQCFSSALAAFEEGETYTSTTNSSGNIVLGELTLSTELSSKYVAVRVNADGEILGLQGLTTEGSAMFASCWCSFGGAAPFQGM